MERNAFKLIAAWYLHTNKLPMQIFGGYSCECNGQYRVRPDPILQEPSDATFHSKRFARSGACDDANSSIRRCSNLISGGGWIETI